MDRLSKIHMLTAGWATPAIQISSITQITKSTSYTKEVHINSRQEAHGSATHVSVTALCTDEDTTTLDWW